MWTADPASSLNANGLMLFEPDTEYCVVLYFVPDAAAVAGWKLTNDLSTTGGYRLLGARAEAPRSPGAQSRSDVDRLPRYGDCSRPAQAQGCSEARRAFQRAVNARECRPALSAGLPTGSGPHAPAPRSARTTFPPGCAMLAELWSPSSGPGVRVW